MRLQVELSPQIIAQIGPFSHVVSSLLLSNKLLSREIGSVIIARGFQLCEKPMFGLRTFA